MGEVPGLVSPRGSGRFPMRLPVNTLTLCLPSGLTSLDGSNTVTRELPKAEFTMVIKAMSGFS